MLLKNEQLLEMYYLMKLSRAFEERISILYKQGKILGGIFSGVGQEAICVGTAYGLEKEDIVIPLHRDVGVCLAKGLDSKILMAQIMGKKDGLSKGKTAYLHSGDLTLGIFGTTSMVGKSLPVADGFALAFKMKKKQNVVIAYFGEGASSQGDVHEAMNFASVHRLPVIFVCENNLYAYSTPLSLQMAIPDVAMRAQAYGFPGQAISGNDLPAVYRTAQLAVERARRGEGPMLIECKTFRWHGHSEHDPALYRSEDEYLEWKSRDPLPRYAIYLREKKVLDDEVERKISERALAEIEEAVQFAEKSPYPEPEEARRDVLGT